MPYGNQKLQKAKSNDRCPRGLSNRLLYTNETCDKCNGLLKNSNWRNVTVFESTNHSWITGFLCVRCSKISRKTFDKFVKPFTEIEIPTRVTNNCKKDHHTLCQMGDCGVCICECHDTKSDA